MTHDPSSAGPTAAGAPASPVVPDGDDPTLLDLFDAVVAAHGDREAMVECVSVESGEGHLPSLTTRRITFGAWAGAADAVAGWLDGEGVGVGDVVALTMPSGIDYAVVHHAVIRLGAVATGINPRLGPAERRHIEDLARPRVSVAELPDTLGALVAAGDPMRRRAEVRSTDPVGIVWTGGTTGLPKGAVFDHECHRTMASAAGPLSAVADRRLSPLPFAHVGTMTRVWDEWSHLITTVVTPTPWTPAAAAALLATEGVTVCQGVPTQYALLCDLYDGGRVPRPGTLRIAGIGGSRIPPELVRRIEHTLGAPVIARYASTETCIATGTAPGDEPEVVATTVGRPTPPVEVRVTTDDGEALPSGETHIGTVGVRSRAVTRGYLDARGPASVTPLASPDGWLTTGDLGWIGDDGNLRLVGRTTEMYIRGGYNVYPAEVENCLSDLTSVAGVAVLGANAPGSRLGEVGVAFIVPRSDGPTPTLDEVRSHVVGHLAAYKAPDVVVVVDSLPLTSVGKVDKVALREQADREAAQWHRKAS